MIPFLWPIAVRAPEGAAGEPARPDSDAGFSLDYVRELRQENKGWRQKAAELEDQANRAREELGVARAEAERRVVHAEVKALAARAGMVDPDGVKLLDLSAVRLSGDGEVEGADALLEAARKERPWLFGDARSSNTTPAPKPRDTRDGRHARAMSAREYEAAKSSRAWRR